MVLVLDMEEYYMVFMRWVIYRVEYLTVKVVVRELFKVKLLNVMFMEWESYNVEPLMVMFGWWNLYMVEFLNVKFKEAVFLSWMVDCTVRQFIEVLMAAAFTQMEVMGWIGTLGSDLLDFKVKGKHMGSAVVCGRLRRQWSVLVVELEGWITFLWKLLTVKVLQEIWQQKMKG